ncbi:hypothetical protein BGZ99_004335 [Dissophora globulifera]|uniref:DOMON domain-containing protein n=1 Tax=Dissophora globulifera TaxID=979702 RepID=A0A9P6RT14_9FUNG|nr:hypothetical protein BGZ99_004335 [Dissophora globulifera]
MAGQGQQSQNLCSPQMCISATIFSADPNTIEFSLFSIVPVAWIGLGIGGSPTGMAGHDLAICWPDTKGSNVVISERAATANRPPSVLTDTVSFQVLDNKSGISSSSKDFTCTFSRPLSLATAPIMLTATSINVIFAVGLETVSGPRDPQKATIQQHAFTGYGVLNIQRKQGASTDANNDTMQPPATPESDDVNQALADERHYNAIVKAHGNPMS